MYVPPFLKKGTFVCFAADNTDFAEDTVDGKGTTHGRQNKPVKQFSVNKNGISGTHQLRHLGWVVASAVSRLKSEEYK